MKTINNVISIIEANENTGLKVANMGLSIRNGNDVMFCKSIQDLKEAVLNIQTTKLYNINVEVSKWMFLQITVSISYLTETEVDQPLNIVKIARNINAFDMNYQKIDNRQEYEFWNNLHKIIQSKIEMLTNIEVEALRKLVNSNISIFKVKEIKKQSLKTRVFKTAWELMKITSKTFSVCLSMAWNLYRLRKRMYNEVVKFAFEKTDGTLRKAKGTLQNVSNLIKGTGKENYSTFSYFDVEVNAFRSFRVEKLVTIF